MIIPPKPTPPDELIGGCIAIWRDAWSNADETISILEEAVTDNDNTIFWQPALVGDGVLRREDRIRSNYNLDLTEAGRQDNRLRVINNNVYEMIYSCSKWYDRHFALTYGSHIVENFQVLKYSTGEEYKAHYDGDTPTRRVISPILYLNDDYEGGELEFIHYGIKLKPKAGDFFIFPANFSYAHIAHPVTSGTKYAIVTWLHDIPQN